jgi:tight adherence protein B
MTYGPNVLIAFLGAAGVLIIAIALQYTPKYHLDAAASRPESLRARLQRTLDQADLQITAGEFVRVALLVGLGLGILLFVGTGAPTAFLLGLIIGVVGYWSYLEDRRDNRRREYQDALSAVVDMFIQAAQAGLAIQASIPFVAERAPQVVRGDFERLYRAIQAGTSFPDALSQVAELRRDMVFDRLAEALTATYKTTGQLMPVLEPLNEMVRGLSAARRRIATAQSRIRWEARIVCAAPFVFIMILNQTAPDLQQPFYASWVGQVALVVVGGMCFAAYYIMNRIGQRAMHVLESADGEMQAGSRPSESDSHPASREARASL